MVTFLLSMLSWEKMGRAICQWRSLSAAYWRRCMAGPKRQSCVKKLPVDARWSRSSLHLCSQDVSSREVQRACYQSRYCCQLASALSRFESVGLSLLGRSATAGVPWATSEYRETHRVREEVLCSLWKFNHQARRRERCEESQTVCRRKWWSFSTPY